MLDTCCGIANICLAPANVNKRFASLQLYVWPSKHLRSIPTGLLSGMGRGYSNSAWMGQQDLPEKSVYMSIFLRQENSMFIKLFPSLQVWQPRYRSLASLRAAWVSAWGGLQQEPDWKWLNFTTFLITHKTVLCVCCLHLPVKPLSAIHNIA